MKRFLYIILLTLLCASSVHGQDNDYSISGEILNDQKQPIPYCTIGVWQLSDSSLVTGGVSDEMGHFKIARLKDGRYEFRVSHLQYETTILPVVIDRNTELSVITLKPSVVALDEVTVIGTKPLLKVYPDKIVYNVLNSPDAKRANLQEVFEKLPLVTPSGSNYLIHGSIAPQYLINGKSSSMLAADPVKVLKSIPASTIKEIEVIANPGAKYDGDNSGGIINIITADKTAAPLSASISTTVNTRGATDANISISTQIDKVFVQGSYTHSEDPDYMKKTTSERINESSSDFYLLKQEGNKTKTHSHTNMFMLESSWTPDTLNVFNFSMNYLDYKTDTHNKELQRNTMYHIGGDETYFYLSKMKSHETYGNMDLSTDYQRKSGRNGTLLLMYKYTDMPKESDDYFLIEEARNYQNPSMHNWQKLHNKENTMQVDYSNNWSDQHYLNAGAKYIIRNNTNNSRYETM
jgi:outer membrane receptor protein involved in Fe transport